MRKIVVTFLLAIGVLASFGLPASAEPRVALVVGNANYTGSLSKLANPVNDANLIAASLRKTGFEVIVATDTDRVALYDAITEFGQKVRAAGDGVTGLFYYAGHGFEAAGKNWLVPVDAEIRSETDARRDAIETQYVLDELEAAGAAVNLIFLDACRSGLGRSAGRGLKAVTAPAGSFIAYSTEPGAIAEDGDTNNSPFAAALAREIVKPGAEVGTVLRTVRVAVLDETEFTQTPWNSSSLTDAFYFIPPDPTQTQVSAPTKMKPGTVFRDCVECPEMVVVPAGSFMMGSSPAEAGRKDNEGPQRQVTIGRDFAVGKFEVTFDQWDACVAAGACEKPADNGWGRGNHPVINISWDDAHSYLNWLSHKTGEQYRLLSEAEWEYAYRAGSTTEFPWGADASTQFANLGDGFGGTTSGSDTWSNTAPIGSLKANKFGLYDMAGNVFEWIKDCYAETYDGAPSDSLAVLYRDCSARVIRGGAWRFGDAFIRAAYRGQATPDSRSPFLGLRVARTL